MARILKAARHRRLRSFSNVRRARPSDEEIRNVLRVLDADEDGVVALEDVQKIRRKLDELHLEETPLEENTTDRQ